MPPERGDAPGRPVPPHGHARGEAEAAGDVERRVEGPVRHVDLSWVTEALIARRQDILDRWLDAAAQQPFHQGRREHAVTDHIPRLFDALVELMRRAAPRWVNPLAPLDDPAVLDAATSHARLRAEQGLQPADIVVEFRLLRHEILRALREHVPDHVPTTDVVGAELLVNDALDGAISTGLDALVRRINEARDEFLALTLHEVRQPLTVIRAAAQFAQRLLAQPQPDTPRVLDILQQVISSTDEMARRLGRLLDASRIALGRLDLSPAEADLAALVRETIERLDPESARRVRLSIQRGLDTSGRWDAEQLRQVVDNLLSNALKYSPPHTPVEVRLYGTATRVGLRVRDRGFGIPPEELPRLFQRYMRTSEAERRGIEGLGLGLYVSRGIVEAHGGRIWAESPGLEQGAAFYVELPRQVRSQQAPSGSA
jgi:signal transduction histidine kinase